MKRRLLVVALSVWVAMFVAVVGAMAQEEEVEPSPQEIEEAQATAQRFVARMLQTRDVAALFDELFLPDFISHFNFDYPIPPSLYARLSPAERRRFFAAVYNLSYLTTLAIMSDHDDMDVVYKERNPNPNLMLPRSTLVKIRRALRSFGDEDNPIVSYERFRAFLSPMEKALAEARAPLEQLQIEKTPQFQKRLAPSDGLGTGIDYRVRAYIGGENVKDCETLIGFPENQKFFRVELPLLIGAILVKDGESMKIVRLTYVDGD